MVIELTAKEESRFLELAANGGQSAEELLHQILGRVLAEESRFVAPVKLGLEDLERGDILEPAQVWAGVEQIFRD